MELKFEYFRSQLKRIQSIPSVILPATAPHTPDLENNIQHHVTNDNLTSSILGFCFASALGFLVLHFEGGNKGVVPLSVHMFGLIMTCSFSAIFVSQFLATESHVANMLKRIGYAFAALAFFLAVAVPSPLWLKILYCFVFLVVSIIAFRYGNFWTTR